MLHKILPCFLLFSFHLFAQPYNPPKGKVFDDTMVPRIDITIHPDSLLEIYANVYSDHEFPADFLYTDATGSSAVNNVGFRLRGNTSRTAGKKSFKVAFNSFNAKQKFYGLEKMNLNGEHNDPAIVRSKLFWETASKLRMPYSRSNHVELYINLNYYGLYINVEHNDENFLQLRYLNNSGNFYKCLYPADLAYLGSNPNNYKLSGSAARVYDLKTNTAADDYTGLKNFITALHVPSSANYQANLENVFNVNAFLRAYAFDILTGNWDNYGGNKNNFYLYDNPETGKFDYLTYDVDNTYGIDFLGKNWGTRNIYTWATDTSNRPLVTRLMARQDYRDRFSYFMKKMIQSAASTANMITYSNNLKNLISNSVFTDPYHSYDYGYNYFDFLDSYTQSLGGHTPYGIQDFISTRNSAALSQLVLNNVAPIFSETRHMPYVPYSGDSIYIKSWVEDENPLSAVYVYYKINVGGSLDTLQLYDDGLHKDEAFGDGIYGTGIPGSQSGDTLYYYLVSTDINSFTGREPRAGFLKVPIKSRPQLFVNELMTKNTTTLADNFGEFDDWFEIYNAGSNMNMNQIYVSDDYSKPGKWNVGNVQLLSTDFLLCWADENASQGSNHASFKLSGAGEKIVLSEFNGVNYRVLDSLSFPTLADNQSIGCYPDGIKPIVNQLPPTPGNSNMGVFVRSYLNNTAIQVYPIPATNYLTIEQSSQSGPLEIKISSMLGEIILHQFIENTASLAINQIDISSFASGFYILTLDSNGKSGSVKIVKQ